MCVDKWIHGHGTVCSYRPATIPQQWMKISSIILYASTNRVASTRRRRMIRITEHNSNIQQWRSTTEGTYFFSRINVINHASNEWLQRILRRTLEGNYCPIIDAISVFGRVPSRIYSRRTGERNKMCKARMLLLYVTFATSVHIKYHYEKWFNSKN